MKKINQDINHKQIAELLSYSTEQLDETIIASLQQARACALQRQHKHVSILSLNTIGHRALNIFPHSIQQWVAITILIGAIIIGITGYWQQSHQHQSSHLDIEILTGDLPIEVFLDK